ncbi:MAG: hypothetical protein JOZ74_17500 [Bradyrhizobium sp.]|nr:hypothetical protein [Bradyrhizobium sp.]
MRKLVVVTAFAAVALTAESAAACDWNRQASTEQQVAAAPVAPAPNQQAAPTTPQVPAVMAESTRKPVAEAVPVVLVSDHH